MTRRELNDKIFVGVIEDNMDPKKLGRCKVRVLNVFDEIPVEDIPWASPWKDLNGNQFILPEKSKVVSVVFDEGNIYKPEYIYAEHYNSNLEEKLATLSGADYTSMRCLMYDHKTQIYSNDSEGLKLDYKFNNINITEQSINLNLKGNTGDVNIGSDTANQQAVLGNHFFDWFDKFINTLVVNGHLGNLMSPILPTPELLSITEQYYSLRNSKFLSTNVNIVDNNYVNKILWPGSSSPNKEIVADIGRALGMEVQSQTTTQANSAGGRIGSGGVGDAWKSTVSDNSGFGRESVSAFAPSSALKSDNPNSVVTTGTLFSFLSQSTPPDPGPINPSSNPDVYTILETMRANKYPILTKPYQMNIVGIRKAYEGMRYTNLFSDDLFLIFKVDDSDRWEVKKYKITTMPGYYQAVEVLNKQGKPTLRTSGFLGAGESYYGNTPNGKPIDVKLTKIMQDRGGMGILKPAFYPDMYQIGEFHGPALISVTNQNFYRDKSSGPIIKYTSEGGGYNAGMFMHRGYAGGSVVSNWSEGCQTWPNAAIEADLFKWLRIHKEKHGNRFNYTLMEARHLKTPSSTTDSAFVQIQNLFVFGQKPSPKPTTNNSPFIDIFGI